MKRLATNLKKKIHQSNVNNKWAKINTSGMWIRRKKKEKKDYETSGRKKSDFKRIEGEEIPRVRNKNQAKTGEK